MPPVVAQPEEKTIAEAVRRLRAGDVVALPTETVYGLGGDTFNPSALQKIYELKGRPFDNPLIAHVADVEAAKRIGAEWDHRCDQLAARFWPGPLTLVLKKANDVPAKATAGLDTIAVRCPDHPVALRVLKSFGGAISAPSANRSGGVSPTEARHVAADFARVDDLYILDGGPCRVGIESTVVDLSGASATRGVDASVDGSVRILRPGSVTTAQLRETLGEIDDSRVTAQAHSPGTSPAHYAPRTPAMMVESRELSARLIQTEQPTVVLCFDQDLVKRPHEAIVMPRNAADYAAKLYAGLREADSRNVSAILIERPPQTIEWAAVIDRLRRATAG